MTFLPRASRISTSVHVGGHRVEHIARGCRDSPGLILSGCDLACIERLGDIERGLGDARIAIRDRRGADFSALVAKKFLGIRIFQRSVDESDGALVAHLEIARAFGNSQRAAVIAHDQRRIDRLQQITRERNGEKIYQIFAETVTFNQDLTDDLFSINPTTPRKK